MRHLIASITAAAVCLGISANAHPAPRTGPVSLHRHALHDDQGDFLGLGASYFQALRRVKFDRDRFRNDLDFLAHHGINYIRTLSMVSWRGKEIAPVTFENHDGQTVQGWEDYDQQLKDMIDIAYDEYGIRTQLTIFADAQLMPTKAARIEHLNRILQAIRGREHKVILLEVANESWQNGFPGDEGREMVRQFGRYLAQRTEVLVALSSTNGDNASIEQMYQNSAADIATEHFSRDIGTVEDGWLPVRDAYRANRLAGVPPLSSNEPIGPGASVNSERDPIKIICAAAYTWMSGLPMYVFHSSAGVSGQMRFEEMPGLSHLQLLSQILPPDIANWNQRSEGKNEFTPFITYANGQPDKWWTEVANPATGVVRHLSDVRGREFYTLPIGILPGGVQLRARRDMTFQAIDPLNGQVACEITPSANQMITLPQGPQAYLIKGLYAQPNPTQVTIDLDRWNEMDGLTHPRPDNSDGATIPVTIGGRNARRNADPVKDHYAYFAAADWFTHLANHPALSITIEYYDEGAGPLMLQYDSNTDDTLSAQYKDGGRVQPTNSHTWKTHVFHIRDAYFGNRENNGSDFRIAAPPGQVFYLDRVMVQIVSPANEPPAQ